MRWIFVFFSLLIFSCLNKTTNTTISEESERKIKCDTFYYRGVDEETGSYYLIEEIICDSIPPYEYVPGRMA